MSSVVTRARTRRMSLLDTDSRPGTPQLDTAGDRGTASPRPTRRTRLNSATMEVRTPTRSTRASVARGETPEPSTPSSVKRTARTPAKATRSVMKQLPLKEETAEEMDVKQEEPSERTGTPVGERRVTRSMSQTPPSTNRSTSNTPTSQPPSKVSSEETPVKEEKHLVETKEKNLNAQFTNKLAVRLEKTPLRRTAANTPLKDSSESSKKTESPAVKVESTLPVEKIKALNESSPSSKKLAPEESLEETYIPETQEKPQEVDGQPVSPELQTSVAEKPKELPESQLNGQPTPPIPQLKAKTPNKNEHSEELVKKTETLQKDLEETSQEEHSEAPSESTKSKVATPQKNLSSVELFLDAEDLPEEKDDLKSTPKAQNGAGPAAATEFVFGVSRENLDTPEPMDVDEPSDDEGDVVQVVATVQDSPKWEQKKSVGFMGDNVDSQDEKIRFPKTPGRDKVPTNRTGAFKPETPIRTPKPAALSKGRSSSTPIAKDQVPSEAEFNPAPPEIDVIKPFNQLASEKKEELATSPPKPLKSPKTVKLFSEEEDEEEHDSENKCEFVDNEAEEAPQNYESGDSMDSSERREIEENEIPSHGESVGSQDTEEESNGEEEEDDDSFVVSDNDEEEDLGALCFSNDEEEESDEVEKKRTPKAGKKRNRIVVPDSSEDSIEMISETKHDKSNCLNSSRLSDAAQKMNNSGKNSTTEASETELENSRRMVLNELNKSERLNKTVPRLDVTEIGDDSSTDSEEKPVSRKASFKGSASVYEIMDSDEFEEPEAHKEEGPSQKKLDISKSNKVYEVEESEEDDEPAAGSDGVFKDEPSHKKLETSKSSKVYEVEESDEGDKPAAGGDGVSKKTSARSSDEEAALLDTLASSDLRHLATMFNPLQKSRRQSLYTASPELNAKEPKLKRRSDRGLGNDSFCPSTSFVEMVAERQRLKRKHLSKSFSGAPEDLEELELCHDRKRLKSSPPDSAETAEKNTEEAGDLEKVTSELEKASTSSEASLDDNWELSEGEIPRRSLNASRNVSLKEDAVEEPTTEVVSEEKEESEEPLKEDSKASDEQPSTSREALKPKAKHPESLFKTKTVDEYMDYCKIFQAANEAVMNQKKQRIAAGGRKPKNVKRASMSGAKPGHDVPEAVEMETVASDNRDTEELPKNSTNTAIISAKKEAKPITGAKKDIKRLQATRQAVGHAVNLLTGSAAAKEPRSLANKLGAKSQMDGKKRGKKQKQAKLNSSDEENHNRKVTRFRNNAGYITVLKGTPVKNSIELIRTKSGIMRVEPSTPKQKKPRNLQSGFREVPSGSSGLHPKDRKPGHKQASKPGEDKCNSARESALRFKERVLARKF
ncbi:hypothetical protein KR067_012537 [Drosophila pandora]|nr:hypothetical protein KR067_012537 [Drosophila pandora]